MRGKRGVGTTIAFTAWNSLPRLQEDDRLLGLPTYSQRRKNGALDTPFGDMTMPYRRTLHLSS
jgi:hypothetical protein